MRIFDIIKEKYNIVRNKQVRKSEERKLEHQAQIEREKERIEGILNMDIPWDYVVEFQCEHDDENEDVCYLEKYVMCEVPRKDIWNQQEVKGVIISGDDLGKEVVLNIGKDFYGKSQLSFWDSSDYVWYAHGNTPTLSSKPLKTIRELNDWINSYNEKCLDTRCQEGKVKSQI